MTRLVWADAETTGLRPDRGAKVWELALIVRDEHNLTSEHGVRKLHDDEYVWQFRPDLKHAEPMALAVSRYYERNVLLATGYAPGTAKVIAAPGDEHKQNPSAPFPGRAAICAKVAALLDGAHLIAANPHFDAAHLVALLEKHGECLTADYHYTDIGSLVRGWAWGTGKHRLTPWPMKLNYCAGLVGLDPGDYDLHAALGDARLARDIYDRVTGGAP